MSKIPIDLTTVGVIPPSRYVGTVQSVEYQVKVGEKWNKEGTQTVSIEEMLQAPVENQRVHLTIFIPDIGQNLWHDLYMKPSALPFVQAFCKAIGISYDKDGFDLDESTNGEIGLNITVTEDSEFGMQNQVKFYKI